MSIQVSSFCYLAVSITFVSINADVVLLYFRWKKEYVHSALYRPSRIPPGIDPIPSLVLQRVAGKDASKQFWKYHNESILKKYKAKLQIGSLDTKKVEAAPPPAPASAPKPAAAPASPSGPKPNIEPLEPFGDLIPFADPSWYQGVSYCYLCTLAGLLC